jgi:hypothetical protein
MTDKKYDHAARAVPALAESPPSHPTTLGNVWIGETRPRPADLAAMANNPRPTSDQAGNH